MQNRHRSTRNAAISDRCYARIIRARQRQERTTRSRSARRRKSARSRSSIGRIGEHVTRARDRRTARSNNAHELSARRRACWRESRNRIRIFPLHIGTRDIVNGNTRRI